MKIFKFVLLILVMVSIGSEAKEKSHQPRLEKGEKRFKKSQEYRLKDFNFVRKTSILMLLVMLLMKMPLENL